jgi:hypothetical protein
MRYDYFCSLIIKDSERTVESYDDNNLKVDKMKIFKFSHNINKNVKNLLNELIDKKSRAKIQPQPPPRRKNKVLQEQPNACSITNTYEAPSSNKPSKPPPPLTPRTRIMNNSCSSTQKIQIDMLSLNDIKQIIKVNDYEFRNEKLENLFNLLPQNEYDFTNERDWLDAFSIAEIIQNFYPSNDDIYIISLKQLKQQIGLKFI